MAKSRKKKNGPIGVLLGLVIAFLALAALWKNETRFDYHRAAMETQVIASCEDDARGSSISLTGKMDQMLEMKGEYVESFTGFLVVDRDAEIFAWDRDEDDEGHVTWSREWMSRVESNSRNSGIEQLLSSDRFLPDQYGVGDLTVVSKLIEFVDDSELLKPTTLTLVRKELQVDGEYFYLDKNTNEKLGDERIRYTGIPVPQVATYFGKLNNELAVGDTSNQRTGFINKIISDSGVLHHIVAGERAAALMTMKSHITKLKWTVRIIGTLLVMFGFIFFFGSILNFLYHIPILGHIASWGAFLAGLIVSLILSTLTITTAYLISNAVAGLAVLVGVVVVIALLWRRARASQKALRSNVEKQHGHALSSDEIRELEFIELIQLSTRDDQIEPKERKFLDQWANKQGWEVSQVDELINRADEERERAGTSSSSQGADRESHLLNLIRLSMADGYASRQELKIIRKAASGMGIGRAALESMRARVRHEISAARAFQ
jgi:hypothetical protein